jgi:hypothetical protein
MSAGEQIGSSMAQRSPRWWPHPVRRQGANSYWGLEVGRVRHGYLRFLYNPFTRHTFAAEVDRLLVSADRAPPTAENHLFQPG